MSDGSLWVFGLCLLAYLVGAILGFADGYQECDKHHLAKAADDAAKGRVAAARPK